MSGSRGVRLTSEELEGVAGGVAIQSGAISVANDYQLNIAPPVQTLDPHATASGTLQIGGTLQVAGPNIVLPDTHAATAPAISVSAHDLLSQINTSTLPAAVAATVAAQTYAAELGHFTSIAPKIGDGISPIEARDQGTTQSNATIVTGAQSIATTSY